MKMPKIQESFRLFTLMDVPVYFHITSIVLLIIFFQLGITFGFFLLMSLLLHEFGHVYVARRFGVHTTKIIVMIFGMVALMNLETLSEKKKMLIALAGPLVNVLIGSLLFACMTAIPMTEQVTRTMAMLVGTNFLFAAFNMIPIQPLDGSHVLRWTLHKFIKEHTLKKVMAYTSLYIGTIFCIFFAKVEYYFTAVIMAVTALLALLELLTMTNILERAENIEDDLDK